MANKEGQNMLPHSVLLWHIDCFELKTIEKQQKQEGLSALFLSI